MMSIVGFKEALLLAAILPNFATPHPLGAAPFVHVPEVHLLLGGEGGEDGPFLPKFNNLHHLTKSRPYKGYSLTADELKKFHAEVERINKKPSKYAKNTSIGKLKSSFLKADLVGKKCCGSEWIALADKLVVPVFPVLYGEPVRLHNHHHTVHNHHHNHNPSSAAAHEFYGHHHDYSDIKPVHEHIEDDVKYDFRTKKHHL